MQGKVILSGILSSFTCASKLFTNLVRTCKVSIFNLQKQGLKILKIMPKDFKIT